MFLTNKFFAGKKITDKFRKREKTSGKNARRKLFKTNKSKYNESEVNNNTTKL